MSVPELAFKMVKQVNWWLNFLAILILLTNIEAKSSELEPIVTRADPKELPYQVFFDIANKSSGWIPKCSGIIISNRTVITTANCLDTKL